MPTMRVHSTRASLSKTKNQRIQLEMSLFGLTSWQYSLRLGGGIPQTHGHRESYDHRHAM